MVRASDTCRDSCSRWHPVSGLSTTQQAKQEGRQSGMCICHRRGDDGTDDRTCRYRKSADRAAHRKSGEYPFAWQAEKLLTAGWETERGMCLIPYHSIGKSGWMKAVIADRMETVYGGKTVVTERPVLAVSAATLSLKAAYGIILHPEHAGGR